MSVRRDADKTYNKLDVSGLKELTPGLDWDGYLQAAGFPQFNDLNVMMPDFFQGVEKLVSTAGADQLRAYLKWNLVSDSAELLSSEFVEEDFDFFGRQLNGINKLVDMRIRLDTCRPLVYRIGKLKDAGKDATVEAAMAKLHVSECYVQSCLDAVQVHGGYGYMVEMEIERDLPPSWRG